MEYTEQDIAAMRKEGDLVSFMGLVSGFTVAHRTEALEETCSHCGAISGQKCTTPRGKTIDSGVHASRKEAGRSTDEKRRPGQWPLPPN